MTARPKPRRAAAPHNATRLAQALREGESARVTPLDLYQLARRDWLAGERIDIGALAARLDIGRATAFRWVGSRDLLLSEILWSLCDELMTATAARQRGRGAQRVAAICEAAVRALVVFEPLRRFVRSDPEYAVRLLTSKLGPVQGRAIERVRALLQYETDRGALVPPLAIDTLAYLIVRLCESFVYAEATSDQQVDVADAGLAIELLLSGKVMPRRAPRADASARAVGKAAAKPKTKTRKPSPSTPGTSRSPR
jgi:AcrR family transcriptional regulator